MILKKYKYHLFPRIKIFSSLIFIFKNINNKYSNNTKRFNKKLRKILLLLKTI